MASIIVAIQIIHSYPPSFLHFSSLYRIAFIRASSILKLPLFHNSCLKENVYNLTNCQIVVHSKSCQRHQYQTAWIVRVKRFLLDQMSCLYIFEGDNSLLAVKFVISVFQYPRLGSGVLPVMQRRHLRYWQQADKKVGAVLLQEPLPGWVLRLFRLSLFPLEQNSTRYNFTWLYGIPNGSTSYSERQFVHTR